jgi:hypothetical protein
LSKLVGTISGRSLVIGPGPSTQAESEQGSVAGSRAVKKDLLSKSIALVRFRRAIGNLEVEWNARVLILTVSKDGK